MHFFEETFWRLKKMACTSLIPEIQATTILRIIIYSKLRKLQLSYSKGKVGELKSQLYRALDNKYISQEIFDTLYSKADIITKKITAFITYLNASKIKGQKFKNRD